eukprot:12888750-Prorocentrum_lima.AAC.1
MVWQLGCLAWWVRRKGSALWKQLTHEGKLPYVALARQQGPKRCYIKNGGRHVWTGLPHPQTRQWQEA